MENAHWRDGGQAMPLLVAILALTLVAMAAVAAASQQAVARSRLQTGSDAAALAGAAVDSNEAARLARLNGTNLASFEHNAATDDNPIGSTGVVTVEVGPLSGRTQPWLQSLRARSAAQELPGDQQATALTPELIPALTAASDRHGELVVIDVLDNQTDSAARADRSENSGTIGKRDRGPEQSAVVVPQWTAELLAEVGWSCSTGSDPPSVGQTGSTVHCRYPRAR